MQYTVINTMFTKARHHLHSCIIVLWMRDQNDLNVIITSGNGAVLV